MTPPNEQESPIWPVLDIAEAHARLTAPGSIFEIMDVDIRGRRTPVWKHMPATARDTFLAGRRHGAREFLVHEDERISFEDFSRAALAVAAELRAQGLRKGERVALAMRNLPEWPVVFFGALLAGAIVTPLNAWWTAPELAFGLRDSGSRFLFCDTERWARVAQSDLAGLAHVYVARGEGPRTLESVIGPPRAWGRLPEGAMPDVPLAPDDDATIFYTSGTSGAPKGALGTHRSLTINIPATFFSMARNALRRGAPPVDPAKAPQRVTLVSIPLFHVTACMAVMVPSLAGGGKLVLMRKFDAEKALDLIAREGVTVTGGVPAVALQLLEALRRRRALGLACALPALDSMSYGGAPSPPSLVAAIEKEMDGAMPGNGWGMTETSATTTTHLGRDYLNRPESCGPALPIYRVRVMDREGLRDLPPGAVGELWVFGANVCKAYWNRPRETEETFRDGWVRTGDLGYLDAEGFCFIVDRARDMVIRGGENIYCSEVENALAAHPAVLEAAVVGLPHPILGEVPAALVRRAPDAALDEDALRAFAAGRLAAFKVPVRILMRDDPLPRNPNGKLVKSELKGLFG